MRPLTIAGAVVLLRCLAHSQAQDPNNWTVLDPICDGVTTLNGKAYQYGPTGTTIVDVTLERVWGTGYWKYDGQPVNFAPIRPFGDPVVESHTLSAASTGSITLRLQWTHPSLPAPAEVTVMVRSTAEAEYSSPIPLGWGTVNNGVQGATTVIRDGENTDTQYQTSFVPQTLPGEQ